jgi:hypothetical protein
LTTSKGESLTAKEGGGVPGVGFSQVKTREGEERKGFQGQVMSFKSLLHVDEKLLDYEDRRAFDFCEETWNRAGRPTKKWDVIPFIESLLKEFIASELSYPRVLLLRKKELQRGTFSLDAPRETVTRANARTDVEACGLCRGAGFLKTSGGGYRPCSCSAGEPHRKRLEVWGTKTASSESQQ